MLNTNEINDTNNDKYLDLEVDNNTSNEPVYNLNQYETDTNKINITKLLTIILAIVYVISLTLSTTLMYQTLKYKDVLDQYKASLDDSNKDLIEFVTTMSEITALYETYDIFDDADFEYAKNAALVFYTASLNDKYGAYLSPEVYSEFSNTRNGSVVGIGVEGVVEPIGFYITNVYEGSPAEESGIQRGDYIVGVNNIEYDSENDDIDIVDLIRGDEGTPVTLHINRNGELLDIETVRRSVSTKSVTTRMIDDVAYVKIAGFRTETANEFKETLEKYKNNGVEKYIIDLRNNSGGLLDVVTEMLDYMVPKGLIVKVEGTDTTKTERFYSDSNEFNGEIVILVNEKTASASELFAQTMLDYNKADVVGTNTFGKGTVLTEFPLSNGGLVSLSTSLYYTASGACIEGEGVTPTYKVELPDELRTRLYKLADDEDLQLQKALEILQATK